MQDELAAQVRYELGPNKRYLGDAWNSNLILVGEIMQSEWK
jgi:hypothetical protein